MSIPTIIIDEHNEAFYIWHYFIENNFINRTENYLLHVDHHEDMECGGYDWDFSDKNNLPENTEEAKKFTDKCLGIADFITPAIYQNIFFAVHILKNLIPAPLKIQDQYVKCLDNKFILSYGNYVPFIHSAEKNNPQSKYHFFKKIEGGLNENDIIPSDNLILDFDLDYFCWDDSLSTVDEKRLEITSEAYFDYISNKNHPFRILPRKILKIEERSGKYFIIYKENLKPRPPTSEEIIIKRIDRLMNYFVNLNLKPKAIDICRSSYSGYLPRQRAEFVEREFIKKLNKIMDLNLLEC